MSDKDNKPKIVKMEDAKAKKPAKNQPKDKTAENNKKKYTKGIVDEILFQYFDKQKRLHFLNRGFPIPDFGLWFYRESHNSASRCVRINKNGVAVEFNREQVHDLIASHLALMAVPGDPLSIYCVDFPRISNLVKRLFISGRRLKTWPKPIAFASDKSPSFEQFSFDPLARPPFKFPFITNTLKNITNAQSLCIRIGSFYDITASRKQAFWIYGDGDGGKTTLFKLLEMLVGERAVAPFDDTLSRDAFGLQSLVDKRLWIGEEIDPKFIRSTFFKRITGGASISINPKGQARYNANLSGFMFFNSNDAPTLPRDTGLLNRIIVCKCQTIPKSQRLKTHEVLERFKSELPAFIGYCIDLYNRQPNKSYIEASTEELDEAVSNFENAYEYIFDVLFKEDPSKINRTGIPSKEFEHKFRDYLSNNSAYLKTCTLPEFRKYVKSRLKLQSLTKLIKVKGQVYRVIPGVGTRKK
jgi:hypothetical protein